jgi:two-component system, NtrC family, sensor histidine kinase HydH
MKLGKTGLSCPLANANLTTRFGVYSFICIAVMTAGLWYIVSDYMIAQMLEREWETTAQLVRSDVKEYLTDEDFKTKDPQSIGHKFDALLAHIRFVPDIVRFKVFNPQSVVIWSDDKRLVGQAFPDDDELQEALRGEIAVDMSSLEKKENVFEQGSFKQLVEVYVPIYNDGNKELLGVFETYKRADSILHDVREARLIVLLGAVGGGLLLYASLFAIVRQAARKIDEQQENLLKMQSELVASQRMAAVGEMAAAVAHGIGNPLSSIRAAAQVAKLDCADNNACQYQSGTGTALANIIEQVDRMQKRMQGLLNFAKPMEPRPAPVELNPLLRDIIQILQTRFTEAGVDPKLDLEKNLPKVPLDANHVEQIFMGLITNALEATPRAGSVTIRTRMEPGNGASPRVVVSVEDTGEGIPLENRQRVFEPFFTTKTHGTGIGLPLAKKFVERNGGMIRILDAPAGGAKIEVAFPWNGLN